jgi:hypothetical protein
VLGGAAVRFDWITTPTTKKSGPVTRMEAYGSTRPSVWSQYVVYIPSIITAPCAKLMMRRTPKMSVSPLATSP